jgi:ribose transport system substrate-binding protein
MRKGFKNVFLIVMALVLALSAAVVFAKGDKDDGSEAKLAATELQILKADDLDEIQPVNPKNVGPNGNPASGVEDLVKMLTPEDEKKVMNGDFTAALALHTTAADWSQLQEAGIRAVLEKYNIELLVVTDAEFKVDKQVGDVESIIELKPDLLIGFPVDRQGNAEVFRKAVDAGITISFIDTIPVDFKHPQDYKGLGLADNYEAGIVAAEILAEAIDYKGKVGVMWFPLSMFHVDQRYYGIRDLLDKYPDIEVVDVQKPGGPEPAATVAENWLVAHPDLAGIVTIWDQQAVGAAGVIDASGKNVKVTGVDLSDDSAFLIASGSSLVGVSSQHPYDQGIAETLIGVVALAGKTPPPYVVVPIEKVTQKSIERSYIRVFRKDPPSQLQKEIDKLKSKGVIKD